MSLARLDDAAIQSALASLDGWTLRTDKLHREFRFDDFVAAFAFMTRCAFAAERAHHHPEWSNVYNRVVVDLTTHDAGGITERDVELAREMNRLATDANRSS